MKRSRSVEFLPQQLVGRLSFDELSSSRCIKVGITRYFWESREKEHDKNRLDLGGTRYTIRKQLHVEKEGTLVFIKTLDFTNETRVLKTRFSRFYKRGSFTLDTRFCLRDSTLHRVQTNSIPSTLQNEACFIREELIHTKLPF